MPPANKPRDIYYYEENGERPCEEWIANLKDIKGKAKILSRIHRAGVGNFGDHKNLSDGIWELRIDLDQVTEFILGSITTKSFCSCQPGQRRTNRVILIPPS